MILKNGKFYEGDKEIPLEVGNREQIELLRAEGTYHHEPELEPEEVEEIIYEGIDLEVRIETITTVKTEFVCLCGRAVRETAEYEQGIVDEYDLDGDEFLCLCGKEYKVYDQGQKVKLLK